MLALAGCKVVGPNFVAPREKVPDQYAGAATADSSAKTTAPAVKSADVDSFWWQQFHDPELDKLEQEAISGNLDLKVAYLRIVESRLQVQESRAQGVPGLRAGVQYTREQLGLAGILKSENLGTTSANTQALLSSIEQPINLFQLGFDASWELDLFGKVRRDVEAAEAQSVESLESRNDLVVTLRAEIAQTYLQLRAAQVLQQIIKEEIAAQRDSVALTKSRQTHGLAVEADVQSAQAQLSSLEAQLPQYDQSVVSSRHSLAVLTGQTPESFDTEFGDTGALPELPSTIDVSIPSTLARRRPDIRQAEAALHAATAQIGVSVAALYPDITLKGTFGLRNVDTHYLFNWASKYYTVGPDISIPIFQGGNLRAQVKVSRAAAAEAAFNYRKTVLGALQEVEDGLNSLQTDATRAAALRDSVGADERALELNLNAYRRGLVTYISVLTVQLQVVQARQQLAEALLSQSTDLVKLYKALGGGWQDTEATNPPST
jgi:NodT family efflux transporter outer membrane factor (OMF) lipoprotein